MQIKHIETLISNGPFAQSDKWRLISMQMEEAVRLVDWPPGTGKFVIPRGKNRNGVVPIKINLIAHLCEEGWDQEQGLDIATVNRPGKLDVVVKTEWGAFAVEWETGNISSSHRAMNKMALGLLKRVLVGAALIVPSRELYYHLTDRIGNWEELAPYVDLWKSVPIDNGVLQIIVVEQDGFDDNVQAIPKGTDGRARG